MRYDQPGPTNDGWMHTVIYGEGAFNELDTVMTELSQTCDPSYRCFWIANWRAGKALAKRRFDDHADARGIILRHYGLVRHGSDYELTWNSFYIAWAEFADNDHNCELFGNDTAMLMHVTGDWMGSSFRFAGKDDDYLRRIDPISLVPRPPSPAIQTNASTNRSKCEIAFQRLGPPPPPSKGAIAFQRLGPPPRPPELAHA
jgi:hypothetical protein